MKFIDFDSLEELFAQPEKIKKEEKKETKKKGPTLITLLDPKKSLGINLITKNLRMPFPDIAEAIQKCDMVKLNNDQINGLLKIIPEKADLEALSGYTGPLEQLAEAERFYKNLIQVPEYALRLDCMKFSYEFNPIAEVLGKRVDEMLKAGNSILESSELQEILHILLIVGNFINTGGYAGNAIGFKLSLLNKIHEIKSNKPRMTMMHVLVESIEKNKPHLLHFYKKLGNLSEISKIDNTENEKELGELTKMITNVKGRMAKLDPESIAKFEDIFKEATLFCDKTKSTIEEINGLEARYIKFFVLDKRNYSLQECLKVMSVFCGKFENAIGENKKRKEQEARLAKRKEEMAKRETLPRAKKKGGLPPPEECVIDNLLDQIRGGLKLRKANSVGNSNDTRKVKRNESIKKSNQESTERWRKSKIAMPDEDGEISMVPATNGDVTPATNGDVTPATNGDVTPATKETIDSPVINVGEVDLVIAS